MSKIFIPFFSTLIAFFMMSGTAFAQIKSDTKGDKKVLVAYFSMTGTTEAIAKKMAKELGADLYKIEPKQPYTTEDLNWRNEKSRTSLEMNDANSRPEIRNPLPDFSKYSTIFLGYPIWWSKVSHTVLSFLESCNLTGKKIIPFATSGSSGIEGSIPGIKKAAKGAKVSNGRIFLSDDSFETIGNWAKSQ